MKRILALVCLLLLAIPLLAFGEDAQTEADARPVLLGDFETTDIYGEAQGVALLQNAPLTFVNVWGTYCPPCIAEMPHLGELAEEYEGRIQFLGIVCDTNFGQGIAEDEVELAKEIVDETGAGTYTHLIPTDEMNNRVLFSITAVPTSFFLDSEGRQVGYAITGMRDKAQWIEILDELLEEYGLTDAALSDEAAQAAQTDDAPQPSEAPAA